MSTTLIFVPKIITWWNKKDARKIWHHGGHGVALSDLTVELVAERAAKLVNTGSNASGRTYEGTRGGRQLYSGSGSERY
jgi:hypothetical protein